MAEEICKDKRCKCKKDGNVCGTGCSCISCVNKSATPSTESQSITENEVLIENELSEIIEINVDDGEISDLEEENVYLYWDENVREEIIDSDEEDEIN